MMSVKWSVTLLLIYANITKLKVSSGMYVNIEILLFVKVYQPTGPNTSIRWVSLRRPSHTSYKNHVRKSFIWSNQTE